MVKLKSIIIGFIGCLCLITLFQNTQVIEIRFLFWGLAMSRIILFSLLMTIGFVLGFMLSNRRSKK